MDLLIILLVVGAAVWAYRTWSAGQQQRQLAVREAADLAAARKVADEDVTRFGEELQRLDTDLLTSDLDEATRQDYQRALDSYEGAKSSMAALTRTDDIRHVTEALEDGRYAIACVRARVRGEALPTRRPPCFFNPAHGPSSTDIEWAPAGGQQRQIPVCAADADRVAQGAEPDIRTVQRGVGRVPYWQGGPAYSPWVSGYFGGYAMSGLLPGFLLGSMLASDWDGNDLSGGEDGFDTGDSGDGGDAGGGDGGDGGGDWGGDSGDGGGDFGGGDFGGGDFGGGDFGGFDF
ncbi:hypothetical protein [Nocardioides mesophilus]|uniref:DUF1542 domain-containing protein n=1 Tax=Nocardioides mesophilus TaxID=433659 RepID=A0A7G9RDK8_9ACTN|nr:hypothetical protein [Nocardioides mesophilus]QNN53683.1 hypothetical protein H9L09_04490 [Nocardioides mesophilus]